MPAERPLAIAGGRPPLGATLRNEAGVAIELLENGAVFAIRHGEVLVNQVLGSPLEGGIGNLYLRRRKRDGITFSPLLGPAAPGRFWASDDRATWEGTFAGIDYSCTLRLASRQPMWFWTIELRNATRGRARFDAVLAQDLGIAHEAAVRTSELYTSQYIDHTILEDDELGYLVCSRQNLRQGDAFPWVMHGCLDGAAGFLADGFQFYGLDFKSTNTPAALARRSLPNRIYQYEFALPTIQSRPLTLAAGGSGAITFFAAFDPDHPAASGARDAAQAREAAKTFRGLPRHGSAPPPASAPPPPASAPPPSLFANPLLFESEDLGPVDLDRHFGADRRHVEDDRGRLLSFFHGTRQHVVLKAKELVMERPTGHVMRSGRDLLPGEDLLSVTAWMFGVFGSQVTIGNTSYNKLLGVCRNPLNVLKTGGQRIFIRTDRGYELLGLPSAFEMGPNGARWIYRDEHHSISIRVSTSLDDPVCRMRVEVERGGPLEMLVTHGVVLGENEYERVGPVVIDADRGRVDLRPAPETLLGRHYPEATFFIVSPDVDRIEAIGSDGLLHADGLDRGAPFVVIRTKPVTSFELVLTGSVLDATRAEQRATAHSGPSRDADAAHHVEAFWGGLGRGATLGGARGRVAGDVARLDELLGWYLHHALVHCTVPHGLEQYSGAAWGLRDVCQGPVELFIATAHLEQVRDILRVVYEHQSRQTGDWPQWFMFDRYREVRAGDSHGDVIHWPIKALCDYVEATGDVAFLDERVAWTDERTGAVTAETDTILAHTERQIERIERDVIPDTALPAFAGGDWEDTLQPEEPAMARRLVSAWTVELAYQTLDRYRAVCERAGGFALADRLRGLCERIRADFNRHLVPDGVVAGLAHFGDDGIEYFLHPRDRRTGVWYRLLPMTRGIIGGLFTVDQAKRHASLIDHHLSFPDGVRLMDRPMAYHGGPSRLFRRAESAANFGREVGLQYVHAHIRYVEAMARIGRPEEAFRGLMVVCPIGLDRDVPNALPRQANAYFSSSDAAVLNRYQASRDFGRLRTGRIGVKGGWRVYSSGPGIYLHQMISNVLGIRRFFDDVVLDPVLPSDADGLTFDFAYEGRRVRYRYWVSADGFAPSDIRVNGRPLPTGRRTDNPYRQGGVLVSAQGFGEALDADANVVDIHV